MKKCLLFVLALCAASFGQSWLQQPQAPEWSPPQQAVDSSSIIMEKVVNSPLPVMLDFWASWCRPCRMLAPTIELLKEKYAGKITVIKVNVDRNAQMAAYFRVQAIPAVFIVNARAVVDYIPGLNPKEAYEAAIAKVLHAAKKPSPADSSAASEKPQSSPVSSAKSK